MTSPSDIFLVDTHALVWYLTEDRKLPPQVVRLLQAAERGERDVIVPTIVLAEGMTIEEKGRASLSKGRILDWVLMHRALVVVEFDLPTVLEMNELSAEMELHDRIIAATARLFGAAVLTRDRVIAAVVDTLWDEAVDAPQGEQPS
ncbi:MAG: PIN domain-containing protein [Chloroflexota bacterium]|nr:PIN domain-containing protein [Chloroflexota bacterium]